MGNELRFVNDFRGVGHEPNVTFQSCTIASRPAQVLVVAKPVPAGAGIPDGLWGRLLEGDGGIRARAGARAAASTSAAAVAVARRLRVVRRRGVRHAPAHAPRGHLLTFFLWCAPGRSGVCATACPSRPRRPSYTPRIYAVLSCSR